MRLFVGIGICLWLGWAAGSAQAQSLVGTWWCEVPTASGMLEYQHVVFRGDGTFSIETDLPGVSHGLYSGQWSAQWSAIQMNLYGRICTPNGCAPVAQQYPLFVNIAPDGAVMQTNFGTCVSPWATIEQLLPDSNHPRKRFRVVEEGEFRPGARGSTTESISNFFRKWRGVLKRLRR